MQKLGLDLDNTIIIYDKLFFKVASERNLVSNQINPTKQSIRDDLRLKGLDYEFTKIQSIVYGERILEAKIADGFKEFLNKVYSKFDIYIVSHKTQFPIKGKKYDLRVAAINFLKTNSLIGNDDFLINEKNIFFESTKEDKIKRINDLSFDYFIDDLIEILEDIGPKTKKILYDPYSIYKIENKIFKFSNWQIIYNFLNEDAFGR